MPIFLQKKRKLSISLKLIKIITNWRRTSKILAKEIIKKKKEILQDGWHINL